MTPEQRRDARVVLNFLLKLAEAEAIRYEAPGPLRDRTHDGVPDPVGALITEPRREALSEVVRDAERFLASAARAAGQADAALTGALARFKGAHGEEVAQ